MIEEQLKRTKKRWKQKDKRFVAVLDIMGFKDLVASQTHEKVYAVLFGIEKKIRTLQGNNDLLFITMFSDSIFIFSKDDSSESFYRFIIATTIISSSITSGIPMNGAIAFGEITVNQRRNIFFGQPIINAHLLQENLFYYGVVFHHSVDQKINEENSDIRSVPNFKDYYIEVITPFKDGNIICNNLNWIELITLNSTYKKQEEILNTIIIKLRQGVSGRPRIYIDNTAKVFNEWFTFCKEVNSVGFRH